MSSRENTLRVCREQIDEQKHKMPLQMKFDDQLFPRKLFITQMEVTTFSPLKKVTYKTPKVTGKNQVVFFFKYPLPETNSLHHLHLKMDGWKTILSFWEGLFQVQAVSFREGSWYISTM